MLPRTYRSALLLGAAILLLASLSGSHASDAVDMTDAPKVQSPAAESPHSKATDTHTAEREGVSMRRARAGAKEYTFQAEVNRLMDILIHSLYSNKDIFLRELISNASDALDKIRFLSLTDKSVLGEGETANLDIRIWLDKETNTLNIRDRGIGMTREDLLKNLGTIAKSGTSAFLEQMQKGGDVNLIGQFGVGFYSVYLVSDWVEVVSKNNADKQHIWASGADGHFSIAEDTENEPLGRGTLIRIHLKPEAQEYADEAKLRELVARYSEFINFPIYLMATKEVDVPVEEAEDSADKADESADQADEEEEEASEEEGAEDVEDEEEEEDDKSADAKPKTKKVQKRDWDLLNDNKALWLQAPGSVDEQEYQKFYKALSKDYSDALDWVHFKAEGDVEFRSILFVPKNAPHDFYDKYYDTKRTGPKLYVRRVFISDDITELLPRYLSFLRGVVDSDTLPLNVSREMLQAHAALRTIRKKLVRKVLDLIRKMAEDERKCSDTKEGDEGRPSAEECGKYATFWREFGRAIKLGIMEDSNNRSRLAKLLRFHTSKSPDALTSLDDYVGRMHEGQTGIYFVAAGSKDEAAKSPFLEALVDKGYEVIYFGDVLDEYIMQHLTEYDDHKFINIAKDDLKLPDKKGDKEAKPDKDAFKGLTKWWKAQLGDKVAGVKLSSRLSSTPCVVVTSKYGQSANMERIMRAQALSDPSRAAMMRGQRTLEINPKHPLIVALRDKVEQAEDDPTAAHSAQLLYETALMESGFSPDDIKAFSQHMYELMAGQLAGTGSTSSSTTKDEL